MEEAQLTRRPCRRLRPRGDRLGRRAHAAPRRTRVDARARTTVAIVDEAREPAAAGRSRRPRRSVENDEGVRTRRRPGGGVGRWRHCDASRRRRRATDGVVRARVGEAAEERSGDHHGTGASFGASLAPRRRAVGSPPGGAASEHMRSAQKKARRREGAADGGRGGAAPPTAQPRAPLLTTPPHARREDAGRSRAWRLRASERRRRTKGTATAASAALALLRALGQRRHRVSVSARRPASQPASRSRAVSSWPRNATTQASARRRFARRRPAARARRLGPVARAATCERPRTCTPSSERRPRVASAAAHRAATTDSSAR